MSWLTDIQDQLFGWIGKAIKSSSWLDLATVIGMIVLILLVIGIITFWWLLLHKFMNHGGDH